jgi:hypothetical protein
MLSEKVFAGVNSAMTGQKFLLMTSHIMYSLRQSE